MRPPAWVELVLQLLGRAAPPDYSSALTCIKCNGPLGAPGGQARRITPKHDRSRPAAYIHKVCLVKGKRERNAGA